MIINCVLAEEIYILIYIKLLTILEEIRLINCAFLYQINYKWNELKFWDKLK